MDFVLFLLLFVSDGQGAALNPLGRGAPDPRLDPKLGRKHLEENPKLAPYLTDLQEARTRLVSSQKRLDLDQEEKQVRYQELSEQLLQADQEHDDAYRAAFYLFKAASYRTDEEGRQELDFFQQRLLPNGLRQTRKAWSEEAGDVEPLAAELDEAEVKTFAKRLSLNKETLSSLLKEVVSSGRALGELLREREALLEDKASPVSPHQARLHWINTVQLFLQIIDHAMPVDDETHHDTRHVLLSLLQERIAANTPTPAKEDEQPTTNKPSGPTVTP